MSKSWTPEELAAASAAMKSEGHMSYEEFCAAPVLRLEHRGRDSWGRTALTCKIQRVGVGLMRSLSSTFYEQKYRSLSLEQGETADRVRPSAVL